MHNPIKMVVEKIILYSVDGRKRIADNTLVALTLMIAESRTEEKDVMVKEMYRKRLGLGRGKKFDPNVFDWDKTNKRIAAMIDFIRVNTKERCNLILTQYRGITITSVRIFKDEEMICTTFLRP